MADLTKVEWTAEKLYRFKKSYSKNSHRDWRETFMFEGREFVIGFAKYLITYLDGQLNPTSKI